MYRSTSLVRGALGLAVLAILIAVIALPTFAADPSASPEATPTPLATPSPAATAAPTPAPTAAPAATAVAPAATAAPTEPAKPDKSAKPDKAAKPEKGTETAVTVTGTVGTRIDADGNPEYTLTVGGTTVALEAGPSWFYGDNHPLKPYVGKKVTIVGSQDAAGDEIEVNTVDGKVIREPGKPPWAGGWKHVGARHPGWTQEKWDRWQAKVASKAKASGAACWPPGHCKDKSSGDGSGTDDLTGADAGN